jgi:hypothetical protein
MPQSIIPFIPLITAGIGVGGQVVGAIAKNKQSNKELDRMHPAPTEQMKANLEELRSPEAMDKYRSEIMGNVGNPFDQAMAESRDRLSGVRDKLMDLQSLNAQRMTSNPFQSQPPQQQRNPFMR